MRPHFNAKSRPASRIRGSGSYQGSRLDAVNERLGEDYPNEVVTLHPTKGFRRMSLKRLYAQHTMDMIRGGVRGVGTDAIREILAGRPI